MLRKYEYWGAKGQALQLLKSYLRDRKQYTQVGDEKSSVQTVTTGTPQGSCLSTLNYLVYVNDLGNLPIRGLLRLFADDKTAAYDDFDIEVIQDDIRMITEYFRINKLTVNLAKTKIMVFNQPNPQVDLTLNYSGTVIERVNNIRYLGLHLDQKLSFETHVHETAKYVASIIGVMFKIRSFVPNHVMEKIYNALIHSKLTYMVSCYGTAFKTVLDRLFVLQKRALKMVHNLPLDYSTINLFLIKAQRCLPLKSLYTRNVAVTVFQVLNNLTLHNMELNYVMDVQRTRAVSLGNLLPRRSRTVRFGDACFEHNGPLIYNSLPRRLKESPSLLTFKKRVTEYLLSEDQLTRVLN